MIQEEYIRFPRLYVDEELHENACISLASGHAHYLKTVMRRKDGDALRLFNGREGEWLASIEMLGKKDGSARLVKQLLAQTDNRDEVHLVFAPIKKARMDFLIEKATELGVTHLHPVLTDNTEVRKINPERIRQQMIEAAEQCERMDVPVCSALDRLDHVVGAWPEDIPLYVCAERSGAPMLHAVLEPGKRAYLVGPEGGFSEKEMDGIKAAKGVRPVSLGQRILRSETAALLALSMVPRPQNT